MPDFNIVSDPVNPGATVIEASAGTGKTYAMSHLASRLILEGTVSDPGEILLVTFTNDAAKELSERTRRVMELLASPPRADEARNHKHVSELRTRFPDHRSIMSRALERIDSLNVSTIHSFCTGVLQTEGTLCGYPAVPELIASADDLVEEAVKDCWESLISHHPLASSLAIGAGWSLEEDLGFFRFRLSLHKATPVPYPAPLEGLLADLQSQRDQMTPAYCAQIGGILAQSTWKTGFNAEKVRKMMDALEGATAHDHRYWRHVAELAEISDHVAKKSNWDAVDQSPVVQLARETVDLMKLARWSFRTSSLKTIHESVQTSLRKNRQITYDGLIDAVSAALSPGNAYRDQLITRLRGRFKVALIDEAQDTDPKQYHIFKPLFLDSSDHRLVMVGDPKQAIYGFRGADLGTYLKARNEPRATLYNLTRTFRAPEPLVKAVNALFRRPFSFLNGGLGWTDASSGLDHDVLLQTDGGKDSARIEFWVAGSVDPYATVDQRNKLIATQTADKIMSLIGKATIRKSDGSPEKQVRASDFAVLVSNARQAVAVEDALKSLGIPAVRAAGDDVMASEEASDLLSVLKALLNPRLKALRFTALATRLLGYTDAKLRDLPDDGEVELENFRRWGVLLEKSGPAAAIARIDQDKQISAMLAQGDDGDRRITNLRQLSDLLQEAHGEHGGDAASLLRWFGATVAACRDRSDFEERQIRLESDAEAVQIVTVHKAKGLEYRLVFCPFLWDFMEPRNQEKHSPGDGSTCLADIDLVGKDSSTAIAIRRAALEEKIRLAYVAVTRAQVKVWIQAGGCCGKNNKSKYPANALDWILKPDETLRSPDEESFQTWATAAQASDRGATHAAGIAAIKREAGINDSLIVITDPPEPVVTGLDEEKETLPPMPLEPLPMPAIPQPWRLTSFSSLTREKNPHWSPVAEMESSELEYADNVQPDTHVESNPFLLAPGSKAVGTAIHDWMEEWDFREVDEKKVRDHLARYTFPKRSSDDSSPLPVSLEDSVPPMLDHLRGARIPGLGITVSQACPEPAASEWKFHLRIDRKLGPAVLAEVFADHPQNGFEGYAEALRGLHQDELEGYLHGLLDRIALKEDPAAGMGREWGVIDWKTNRLGSSPSSYRDEKLRDCAVQNHYYLQIQLYLVALRRYLGPEEMISGGWLVFLRGVSKGTEHGILHIPYHPNLVGALDRLFA
jgi:exodeoxyribonuclease V beta subunit